VHRVLEGGRHARHEVAEALGVGVHGRLARQQHPERGRHAEHVRARRDRPSDDLRRHEAGRADGGGALAARPALAGDAEVHQHHSVASQDQVLRLHVAVDDVLLVDIGERLTGLPRVVDGLPDGQPGRTPLGQHLGQARAIHQLHHEEVVALVFEVVEHVHDARVVERGQQASLDLETARRRLLEQALQRHLVPVFEVPRAIDRAHRAARDGRHDLVGAAAHGHKYEPGRYRGASCPS
jgi:hypothetical protein